MNAVEVHARLRAIGTTTRDNEGAANAAGRAGVDAPDAPGPNPYTRGADGIMFPRLAPQNTDPTPLVCTSVWSISGPCPDPVEYIAGAIRSCGCGEDGPRYYCARCIHVESYGCLYCRQQTVRRTEPVRLRG